MTDEEQSSRRILAGGLALGLIAGVAIGMGIGALWAKDRAGWVAAIGAVVAAVGTIVAAIYAVRAFRHEVARLRAENKARDEARSDAEFRDAQNVLIKCWPAGGGRDPGTGVYGGKAFSASWTVGSTVPAINVRVRVKPYARDWHGLQDAIPAGASGQVRNLIPTEPYEIPDCPSPSKEFMYRAEVRYTLAGQRWSRTGFQDPVRVSGPDPDD